MKILTLYGALGIRMPVQPVSRAEFSRPAARPPYSALTTLQDPQILLPPWTDGVAPFARALRNGAGN